MIDGFKIFRFEDSENGVDIISAMSEYIESLKDLLDDLDFGDFFNTSEYTRDTYTGLLKSFIAGQRGKFCNIVVPGSWGIFDGDEGIPSDARVDFVYMPTYIICSILSRTYLDYPEIVENIPGYVAALKKGLRFCSLRNLAGHGYDLFKGQAEALEILGLGHIPELLEKHHDWCPKLRNLIQVLTDEMQEKLEHSTARGFWGESLEDAYRGAIASLMLERDTELVKRIKEDEGGLLK